jgi:GAF domain-containing protein
MERLIRIFLLGNDLPAQNEFIQKLENDKQVFELIFVDQDEFIRSEIGAQRPDLILASNKVIETTGGGRFFERTNAYGRSIPIIVIGDKDTAEEAVRFLKMGAADYLPYSKAAIPELPQKIVELVKNYQRQDNQSRTMETLGRISLALNRTRDLSKLLDLICKESGELFNVSAAFIWLLEGDELVGFAGYGYRREDFIGIRVSLVDSIILGPRVIREKRPMFVNNAPHSEGVDPALISHFNTQAILGTPLIVEEQAIGALMLLENYNPYRFGDDDIELAELLGSHAAIAISNARLYEEISERVQEASLRSAELEALREASFHLTANLELKPLLEAILEQAMRLIDANNVHVFLYHENNIKFGAARWADGREGTPYSTVRPDGLTATVIKSGEAVIISDVNESPLFENWRWGGGIAGFPLKIGDELLGVMNIATRIPHTFDKNEQRVLKLFADEAAIAIKNSQLFEATRRQLEELTVLHAIALVGVKAIDVDYLIEETTRIIGDTFYPNNFGVLLLDESKEILNVHPSYRLDHITHAAIKVTEGVVGRVATTGQTIRLDDVRESAYYLKGDPTTRSELCVPLKIGDRTIGVINAESHKIAAFSSNDERLLITLAGQLAIALERLRAENVELLQRRRLLIISSLAREMTGSLKVQERCSIISDRRPQHRPRRSPVPAPPRALPGSGRGRSRSGCRRDPSW